MASASLALRFNRAALRRSLEPIRRRVERPFEGASGRQVVKIMRSQVQKEFAGAFWLHPSGGRRPWEKTHDFGRRKASARPLQRTGRYFRSLMGGAGAIEQITPRRVVVGSSVGYGAIHRGGSGARISTSPLRIRPRKQARRRRPPMFWKLLGTYGVPLRRETLLAGLRLPRRPHMTRHPELERRTARAVEKWIAKGKVA